MILLKKFGFLFWSRAALAAAGKLHRSARFLFFIPLYEGLFRLAAFFKTFFENPFSFRKARPPWDKCIIARYVQQMSSKYWMFRQTFDFLRISGKKPCFWRRWGGGRSMWSAAVGRHALMPPRMTHAVRNLRSDLGIAPYVGGRVGATQQLKNTCKNAKNQLNNC